MHGPSTPLLLRETDFLVNTLPKIPILINCDSLASRNHPQLEHFGFIAVGSKRAS